MTEQNSSLNLDSLAKDLHHTAVVKGFWTGGVTGDKVGGKLALIHSEVTEVLEAYRKDKGSYKIVEEIADILIRTLDLYDALATEGIVYDSLDKVMEEKAQINIERPAMHGHRWG